VNRVDDPSRSGTSGWTFFKVIGVLLGVLGMVGFGLCTLCGVAVSFDGGLGDLWIWVFAGAVMTGLSCWLVFAMFRKARETRDANRRIDQ
jgi:hypothetical protein